MGPGGDTSQGDQATCPVAVAGGPPTTGRTGSATSWPATTLDRTASTGTSPRTRAAPSSCAFVRYLRTLYPAEVRIAIVLDNFSPHTSTKTDQRVAIWAEANNVELAYTPTYRRWLNRIEAQFQALRYFALDGTDQPATREQASMIRRYIIWRNRNAHDRALRELVKRANVA